MHEHQGKTAIFFVLFFMSLSLHIQFPIFTPFAASLGATSFFISILLSTSSLANLVGHVMAGPYIDRIGKKPFIVIPLLLSSLLMFGYGMVSSPMALFILRFFNAFILAFLMPACFALLSGYAKSSREQGKNMAINGLLVTVANIVAPLIGGHLVEHVNYQTTYFIIGFLLFLSGTIALIYVKEAETIVSKKDDMINIKAIFLKKDLIPIYFIAFALMYSQGTLVYELPLLVVEKGWAPSMTGQLFSYMGIGTLSILLMFWLNWIPSFIRTVVGMLFISLCYYQLAHTILPISMNGVLFSLGMGFGLLFPAITTLVTERIEKNQHGKAFGILSAVFSLGMVTSPLIAGIYRHLISPYYINFFIIMVSVLVMGYTTFKYQSQTSS